MATSTILPSPPHPTHGHGHHGHHGHPPPTIPGPTKPVPFLWHIEKSGQDALWAGFVVFLVSTLLIAVLASRLHVKHRAFHLLTMLITGIAAVSLFTFFHSPVYTDCLNLGCMQLSYYAMATQSGITYVPVGWRNIQGVETEVFRQIYWARCAHITQVVCSTHQNYADMWTGPLPRLFYCLTSPSSRAFPGLMSWHS
jgi:hypothetical protein